MPELSVILPTLNERGNIPAVTQCLAEALAGIDYEVIFVDDDSDDGTAALVREYAQRDRRVRVIHRIHRRGLASASVEGMMASSAPYIAVMDADLQHDERILPAMLELIKREHLDMVVATRRAEGGRMGEFAKTRVALSEAGRRLAALIVRTPVSDPMSGYFVVSRSYLDEVVHSLSCKGFKILLDLLASARRPLRIKETPYTFRSRLRGESKLDTLTLLEYLELLLNKTLGRWLPIAYLLFAMVGTLGLACHLLLVSILIRTAGLPLANAQTISGVIVIAVNFFLNNQLTFRPMRLKGMRILGGLGAFYAACLIGLIANVRLAGYLHSLGAPWYGASLMGIIAGSIWNYGVSRVAIWRMSRPHGRIVRARGAAGTVERN